MAHRNWLQRTGFSMPSDISNHLRNHAPMQWSSPRGMAHASPRFALLALFWTGLLGWLISPQMKLPIKGQWEPPVIHSITLLTPAPAPAPDHVNRQKLSAAHSPTTAPMVQSTPSTTITVGSEVPQAPNADAAPMRDPGRLVIDAHALRSAIQSRGVERLAQESGRPLINSNPTPQEKWRQSIQKAEVPDCLEANPNGMGLLNAPVLLFKAITDKCK